MPSFAPSTILLAFANDISDERRYLRNLQEEGKQIGEALMPAVERGLVEPPSMIFNAVVDDVIAAFQQPLHRERIRVFHFGGHADGSKLIFEDPAGRAMSADVERLAAYLGQQESLVLVFLNGCSTEGQIRQLRQAGVKAVVATTADIEDRAAAQFAAAFYKELATSSLQTAFDRAGAAVLLRHGDHPDAIFRDVARQSSHSAEEPAAFPWLLDCDPSVRRWRFAQERRLLSSKWAAVVLTAVVGAMLFSAPARRAALGIGSVPTAAEQRLWLEAKRTPTGEGLRAYLRSYPMGAYAEEASARLAGCARVDAGELASPRPYSYAQHIKPLLDPLPTEEAARRDALERGARDAASTCERFRRSATLTAATSQPRTWSCPPREGGFACGYQGDLVCEIRERIWSERCIDAAPEELER